ncbi:hypothetical protein GPA10_18290 [Streptomyces sp. p1417]|uniref:Uncharacterized protein n=1 Tax=Streptomyces typhae TaxID=2681492 RepID=A0A6L6WYS6_9ACTN|nr:hypothetical protein [Streptomyces typhae]MVO86653.1 hypothetical protein [Streptomyces typhae]
MKILMGKIRDRWKKHVAPKITAPRVSAVTAVGLFVFAVVDRVPKWF